MCVYFYRYTFSPFLLHTEKNNSNNKKNNRIMEKKPHTHTFPATNIPHSSLSHTLPLPPHFTHLSRISRSYCLSSPPHSMVSLPPSSPPPRRCPAAHILQKNTYTHTPSPNSSFFFSASVYFFLVAVYTPPPPSPILPQKGFCHKKVTSPTPPPPQLPSTPFWQSLSVFCSCHSGETSQKK